MDVDPTPPPAEANPAGAAAAAPTVPPTAVPPTPKREPIPRKKRTGRDGAKGTAGGREAAAGPERRPEDGADRRPGPRDSPHRATASELSRAVEELSKLTHSLSDKIDVRAESQAMSLKDLLSIGRMNKPALLLSTDKHSVSQKLIGSKPS